MRDSTRKALSPLLLSMHLLGAVPVAPDRAPRILLQLLYSATLLTSLSHFTLSVMRKKYEEFTMLAKNDSGRATMEFMNVLIILVLFVTLFLIFVFLVVNGRGFDDVLKRLDVICNEMKCDKEFYGILRRYSCRYALLFWSFFVVIMLEESLFWKNINTIPLAECMALFLVRVLHTVLELQMAALAYAISLLFNLLNNQITVRIKEDFIIVSINIKKKLTF